MRQILKRIPFFNTKPLQYIDCKKTVKAAQSEGLSVGDYVEKIWDQKGQTQKIIDEMQQRGCFEQVRTICEIGPGTGRYLDKILTINSTVDSYIIYETARDWSEWLTKTYPVIQRKADGYSLHYEANQSCELVHAHGVFVYLSFIHCFKYFKEMLRVTKPGGFIVFDFYPTSLFDVLMIEKWIKSSHSYPVVLPEDTIQEFFAVHNAQMVYKFDSKHGQGYSRYHVYKMIG